MPVSGSRVVVPFRNRKEIGICLGPAEGDVPKRVKRIIEVQKSVGALTGEIDVMKYVDTRFLPERFRKLSLSDVNARIERLKAALGGE